MKKFLKSASALALAAIMSFSVACGGGDKGDGSGDGGTAEQTQKYTVTFDANGGEVATASMQVEDGAAYGELPSPTREGYSFLGWYTMASGGTKVQATDTVEGDHTLYAQWKIKTFLVRFDNQGGVNATSEKEVTYGATYGSLPVPTKAGYAFLGWYTAVVGGLKVDESSTVNLTDTMTAQILYAHWAVEDYTLTFDARGGSTAVESKTVTYDATYGQLPTPTREGFTFLGWYTAENGGDLITADDKVAVTANTTLFAHWATAAYTVTFVHENETVATRTVEHNDSVAKITTWDGFALGTEIVGYYTDAAMTQAYDFDSVVTGDLTIYVKTQMQAYTIIVNNDGDTSLDVTVNYNETYTLAAAPTRTYYTFVRYELNGEPFAASGTYTYTTDIVVTAVWTKDADAPISTVSFLDGEVEVGSQVVNNGTTLTANELPSAPTKTGYDFDCWCVDAALTTSYTDASISVDTVLYAKYTAKTYAVSFNGNGTRQNPTDITVTYGGTYGELPTVSRTGYDFLGWYTQATGGTKIEATTAVEIASAQTLYAHWAKSQYVITFNANGGTVATTSIQVEYGTAYGTLPTPTRTGYAFDGWYTAESGGEKVTASTLAFATTEVYARWTASTFTVNFDANGGSVDTASMIVTYGSTYGALPTPTNGNLAFLGWYTAISGGTKIEATTTVSITATQTLYAQWAQPDMTAQEVVTALSSTVYTNSNLTDDYFYGISDLSNVGVVAETANQELYEIDTTGCYEINYSSMSGDTDYQRLQAAFALAKEKNDAGQKAVIYLPQNGTITINAAESSHGVYAYALDGYNGLYVKGNNCKIMIDYEGFNYRGFLYVSNSSDVRLNDFTVDYVTPTAVTGWISAMDETANTITVTVDDEFSEFYDVVARLASYKPSMKSYLEFDNDGVPMTGGNFVTDPNGYQFIQKYDITGNRTDGYEIAVKFVDGAVTLTDAAKGQLACLGFSMYEYNGFTYAYSNNIYMENVTLNTCPGMGLVGEQTTNIFVNRFNLTIPANSKRLMTSTADGSHFAECFGEVKITNSIFEYSHDDALNIQTGYYYDAVDISAQAKTFTLSKCTQAITTPNVGDIIEFYDTNTFAYLGYAEVATVSGDGTVYYITTNTSLLAQGALSWGSSVVATNVSKSAKLTFTNNIVRNKRNRGLLVQVRGAQISNNAFFNVGHGAIMVHSSLDQYNEATMPQNVVIENNKFVSNNRLLSLKGDIHVFAQNASGVLAPIGTIKGVTIRNNFLANSGNAGVSMQAATDSTIANNLFANNGKVNSGEMYDCAIELGNSGEITISENYQYYPEESTQHAGIVTSGTTNAEDGSILLSGNTNIEYKVYQLMASTTEVQKLGTAITIDGNLSDWASQGNSIEMYGSSLATGESIDPEAYNSYFDVEVCKIGWTDEGIYIAFSVKDDIFLFESVNNFWLGDCFEMFLCTDLSMGSMDVQLKKDNADADVMQFAAAPTWTNGFTVWEGRTSAAIVNGKSSIQVACVTTDTGYAGEIFLPFSVFKNVEAAKDNGEEVAIAFVFADAIRTVYQLETISGVTVDEDRHRLQVANLPHHVEAYKTITAGTPRFKFVD